MPEPLAGDAGRGRVTAPGHRWSRALLAGAAVAAVGLAAGCATIPSTGTVLSTALPPAQGGGGPTCCALLMRGPQPGWTPAQTVSNFLVASASFANDHAIARQYLTAAANRNWRPSSPVTIVAQQPSAKIIVERPSGQPDAATVTVRAQQVATLDPSGEYVRAAPGSAPQSQHFDLERNASGEWRISSLPSVGGSSAGGSKVSRELLLSTLLFHEVYESRNLYFFAGTGDRTLVPDPVYVPRGSPNMAASLVQDLRHDPGGWLAGAAMTKFPPHLRVLKVQIQPGRTAVVSLTVPRTVPVATEQAMAEQVVWTLTSPAYSPPLLDAVRFVINGHPWSPRGSGPVRLAEYGPNTPRWWARPSLYLDSPDGAVQVATWHGTHIGHAPGELGSGRFQLNAIAVSPDGRFLAGVTGAGAAVYTAPLTGPVAGDLRMRLSGSSFTAPSWDVSGNLWVAGQSGGHRGLWVIPAGGSQAMRVRVDLPPGTGPVTGVEVAPDGVRVALIVGRAAKAQVLIGAIASGQGGYAIAHTFPLGPGLTGVTAVTWYDENHVLASASGSASGTRLCEVPVNGDGASCAEVLGNQASITSITAAGPQNWLYLGLSTGRMEKAIGLGEPWTDAGPGRYPAYPG